MKGRATVCGSTMVMATAKAPTPVSSSRAKIGVAARCGHSTSAVRPIRMTVPMLASAGTRRGHHSLTPNICQPPRISQCSSGGVSGAAMPLRSGTSASRRCMCQADASVSSSIGAVVGRHASAPKISTPTNRNGAERDSFCRNGERRVSSRSASTLIGLRSPAWTMSPAVGLTIAILVVGPRAPESPRKNAARPVAYRRHRALGSGPKHGYNPRPLRPHCALRSPILLDHLIDRAAEAVEILPLRAQRLEAWVKRQPQPVGQWVRAAAFAAKPGSVCLIPSAEGGLAQVLVGIEEGLDRWSLAALPTSLPKGDDRLAESLRRSEAEAACFAWAIGAYRFQRYKKRDGDLARLVWPAGVDRAAVRRLVAALTLARDLINTPAEDMGPPHLADAAKAVAKAHKATFNVIVGDDLLKKNYPAIHAVGRAASRPPRLIDLSWGSGGPRLTLVGKGVCFDTGGLDLKPSSGMLLMKKDMGGAALMLALAQMIMDAALKIRLRLLIPAVENSVSGNSYRPLDVIRTRKGITVEIGNTDAEGRVILCDALAEAQGTKVGDKPDLILDAATLTGAARVALGPDLPALFCNDDEIAEAILRHGKAEDDPLWRLPLHKGYRAMLDSKVADINNVSSGPYAGAITAALYLQEFIDSGMPWAHIDTLAWNTRDRPGRPEGGEALCLRALFSFVSAWAQQKKGKGAAIIAPKAAPRQRPLKARMRRRR